MVLVSGQALEVVGAQDHGTWVSILDDLGGRLGWELVVDRDHRDRIAIGCIFRNRLSKKSIFKECKLLSIQL
jgi:hypothetical protein